MLNVLVIDDERSLLDAARLFLERFGNMKVQTALSAKEALGILTSHTFDAIVVDYDMPEINGIGFLKIIRSKGDTTPVILFTGVGREHAAIEALNNGADFFLRKGDAAESPFREMVHMIRQSVDRRSMGRAPGTTQKLLSDIIQFFPDPAFAIDREGKVIAWNHGMADVTGIESKSILGKGDGKYSVPFFGHNAPMLTDLIFENDATIAQNGYFIISRELGTIIAWTKATGKQDGDRIYWMKATPLHDAKGLFIGVIGAVRDITEEMGEELLRQLTPPTVEIPVAAAPAAPQGSRIDKLLGKAKSSYKEGVRLFYRESKYADAIPHFDRAIEIDPSLAPAWYDRGLCLRELSKDDEALKSFNRALELAPNDEEYMFSRAEMLKKIGILRGQKTAVDAAVRAFHKVIEINPNHVEALNGLAVCMKEQGKDDAARQYFDRARNLIRAGTTPKKARSPDSRV